MAEYAIDPEGTVKTDWNLIWGGTGLGLVDTVDPTKLKLKYQDVKAGTTGHVKLSDRFVALEGGIMVQVREVTLARITALVPWFPDPTPPLGELLYQYAEKLVLHPTHLPAATVTQDIGFYKAVPTTGYLIKRDGEKEDVWELNFEIYPDWTKLAAGEDNPYGWIGAEPA